MEVATVVKKKLLLISKVLALFKMFEKTRTFNAGIINIRLEHRTFFKLLLFEEVPRNF